MCLLNWRMEGKECLLPFVLWLFGRKSIESCFGGKIFLAFPVLSRRSFSSTKGFFSLELKTMKCIPDFCKTSNFLKRCWLKRWLQRSVRNINPMYFLPMDEKLAWCLITSIFFLLANWWNQSTSRTSHDSSIIDKGALFVKAPIKRHEIRGLHLIGILRSLQRTDCFKV